MIRRLLRRLLAGGSTPPASEPGCRCHPAFHDLGVHAPGHTPVS